MLCPFVFPFAHFSIKCCNQRRNEFFLPGKEGSPKVAPFFNRGKKGHYPNDCLLVQNVHTTFWQSSEKKEKKGKVVTTGIMFNVPQWSCFFYISLGDCHYSSEI
jgi:hypothetical protein